MKFHQSADPNESRFGENRLRLGAVILYEDLGSGVRGRHTLERLVRHFPGELDFDVALWSFGVLLDPTVRERALAEATEARIVMVSAHGQGELPPICWAWLKQWLERKSEEPCALVVSLDIGPQEKAPGDQIISSLQTAASSKCVTVFPDFRESPAPESDLSFEGIERRASAPLDYRDWPEPDLHRGIND